MLASKSQHGIVLCLREGARSSDVIMGLMQVGRNFPTIFLISFANPNSVSFLSAIGKFLSAVFLVQVATLFLSCASDICRHATSGKLFCLAVGACGKAVLKAIV